MAELHFDAALKSAHLSHDDVPFFELINACFRFTASFRSAGMSLCSIRDRLSQAKEL